MQVTNIIVYAWATMAFCMIVSMVVLTIKDIKESRQTQALYKKFEEAQVR